MARPEFGRPKNLQSALSRLPDFYEKPLIGIDPYERVVVIKEFIENLLNLSKDKKLNTYPLNIRSTPVELEAVALLSNLNSFYRQVESNTTYQWSFVGSDCYPWPIIYATGENSYHWWQVTDIDPHVQIDDCRLICIETNDSFEGSRKIRFDENSEFDFIFVSEEELRVLNQTLVNHNVDTKPRTNI